MTTDDLRHRVAVALEAHEAAVDVGDVSSHPEWRAQAITKQYDEAGRLIAAFQVIAAEPVAGVETMPPQPWERPYRATDGTSISDRLTSDGAAFLAGSESTKSTIHRLRGQVEELTARNTDMQAGLEKALDANRQLWQSLGKIHADATGAKSLADSVLLEIEAWQSRAPGREGVM